MLEADLAMSGKVQGVQALHVGANNGTQRNYLRALKEGKQSTFLCKAQISADLCQSYGCNWVI